MRCRANGVCAVHTRKWSNDQASHWVAERWRERVRDGRVRSIPCEGLAKRNPRRGAKEDGAPFAGKREERGGL